MSWNKFRSDTLNTYLYNYRKIKQFDSIWQNSAHYSTIIYTMNSPQKKPQTNDHKYGVCLSPSPSWKHESTDRCLWFAFAFSKSVFWDMFGLHTQIDFNTLFLALKFDRANWTQIFPLGHFTDCRGQTSASTGQFIIAIASYTYLSGSFCFFSVSPSLPVYQNLHGFALNRFVQRLFESLIVRI